MMGIFSYLVFFAAVVLILGTATIGLNLQWGHTGIFNAGVVGFFGIGAYAMGILTAEPRATMIFTPGLPWVVGIVGALVVTGLAAWIVGVATVRLRGDYLAIATFGIAVTFQLVALNWEGLTGGSLGLPAIPKPFGHQDTPLATNLSYLAVVAATVAVVYFGQQRIIDSPWGRTLKAIREDETAAMALGKNIRSFRLQAFVLGSMLIGLSGALYASFIGFISPFDFLPILTFQIWTMLIVGGSGNNRGALLGTVIVWGLWSASGVAIAALMPVALQTQGGAIQAILIGAVLVLTLLFRPGGLIGEDRTTRRGGVET